MGLKMFFAAWLLVGIVITGHSVRVLMKDDPYTEKIVAEFVACVPPIQGHLSMVRLKFKYSYNGRAYEGTSILETGSAARNYKRGREYEIYIDPDKPERLAMRKNDGVNSAVGELIIGILVLLFGIILLLI